MRRRMEHELRITAASIGLSLAISVSILGIGQAQPISVVVNNQVVPFAGTPPQEIRGSVLVPLRGVFEQLGASVQYDAATKTIEAKKGPTTINLPIGSSTAFIDGQPKRLDQPATVIAATTLVPLRFVAEALGANVQWVGSTHTVYIVTPTV